MVLGLSSCPAARGMVIPQPQIEPTSRALEGRFLTTGPLGKSLWAFFAARKLMSQIVGIFDDILFNSDYDY